MSGILSVGLLFGGESPEHEVSIVTARAIAQHLDPARFAVRPMGIARNGVWAVKGDPFARLAAGELPEHGGHPFLPLEQGAEDTPLPDLFFNALHGAGGEDGQIQGYLELLHRPYTGAGLLAMAAGMDKWITKRLWESEGLPVVPYAGLTEERWARDRAACLAECAKLGLPLFVKPANLGSSIGVEKVKRAEDLPAALDRAFTFDRRVLVEQGLDIREIEVAVLGGDEPLVSQPGEVLVADEFYTFEDKYIAGKSRTEIPAQIPEELADLVRKLAARAFAAVDGYGMARVDFFLERITGRVFLNELNFIPGFTSISMYPKMMAASGVPYAELLTRLIDLALARHAQTAGKQKGFKSGSDWFRGK
ncbi:D-alanine--D-alanine ligase [Geothrix rubra]|uniref:D-alanine--D-alanine ligase n=1 Tax=Geothrix rubra TaxID=2927977 RepID=A0ABQ5Q461_9BACT|nr:D-alanine--D-alanine ligase family protein [Geothrix rubra]GLH69392.1 D-alanine--D-alanine ligase [Geothrix rubra]